MDHAFIALQTALRGRYSLERELGRGGMGIVYVARDAALDRPVAIKLLPPDMARDAELRERFLREARTAAQLSHPNIVPIHLVEEQDGLVYFVMAFIDGESLGERVQRTGPLPAAELVRLLQDVSWALAYAHGRGVVHRDIKPDNILIERGSGRAVVTDFGIARRASDVGITSQGLVLGTPQYMAPEQFDAQATLDGRADIYALGGTAFFAATGRLPFAGETVPQLMAAHIMEPPPPVASLTRALPAKLSEAIDRCLAKAPEARWASGEALAAAAGQAGAPSAPTPPSIRNFISAVEAALTQAGMLLMVAMFVPMLMPEQSDAILKLLLALMGLPLLTTLAASRGMGIAGFGTADLAAAIEREALVTDRYTEHVQAEMKVSLVTMQRPLTRIISGLFGAMMVATGVIMTLEDVISSKPAWKILLAAMFAGLSLWMGTELLGHATQLGPFRERLKRFFENTPGRGTRIRVRLWTSWPVRLMLALGRAGLKTHPSPAPPTSNAPTAVLIAKAAGDMFESLPAAERAALAMVPDVLKRLESSAARLRERRERLDGAIAAVGETGVASRRASVAADLETERDVVDQRLRMALEAMENLRLDLLKLRAGMGTTDDLTEAIEAARRIGDEVEIVVQSRALVEELRS